MTKISNQYSLTNILTADLANSRLGINNVSPTVALDVTGAGKFSSSVTATTFSSVNSTPQMDFVLSANTAFKHSIVASNFSSSPVSANILDFRVANGANSQVTVMNLTGAGNVGIGTSSPGELLTLSKSTYPTIKLIETTASAQGYFQYHSGNSYFILNAQSNHPLLFGTNDTERMRIASDGVVTIKGGKQLTIDSGATGDAGLFIKSEGTTTTGFTNIQGFHGGVGYNSSIVMQRYGGNILMGTTSNNGERLYVSGDIRATGSITANSDITLKKNLLKIENALEKVEQINGYTYELKADDSKRHAGLIAQEVEIVLPEIVNAGTDTMKGIEYGNISALLVEAIKELSAEITLLKNK